MFTLAFSKVRTCPLQEQISSGAYASWNEIYRAHEPMAVLKENNTQLFFSFLEFLEQSIELLLFGELKIPWFLVNKKYHG